MQTIEMLHTRTRTLGTHLVQYLQVSCFKHNETIELKNDFNSLQIFAHKSTFHEKSIGVATVLSFHSNRSQQPSAIQTSAQ